MTIPLGKHSSFDDDAPHRRLLLNRDTITSECHHDDVLRQSLPINDRHDFAWGAGHVRWASIHFVMMHHTRVQQSIIRSHESDRSVGQSIDRHASAWGAGYIRWASIHFEMMHHTRVQQSVIRNHCINNRSIDRHASAWGVGHICWASIHFEMMHHTRVQQSIIRNHCINLSPKHIMRMCRRIGGRTHSSGKHSSFDDDAPHRRTPTNHNNFIPSRMDVLVWQGLRFMMSSGQVCWASIHFVMMYHTSVQKSIIRSHESDNSVGQAFII